jgi:hypothetical protein
MEQNEHSLKIWPSGFRREYVFKSIDQQQELPVPAMFVNKLARYELFS